MLLALLGHRGYLTPSPSFPHCANLPRQEEAGCSQSKALSPGRDGGEVQGMSREDAEGKVQIGLGVWGSRKTCFCVDLRVWEE